ncbi:MAG: hypothetical protein KC432_13200 [Thermomicrobiales bacterium]|nr:hypothetical protein [Thermomicrobiales bacterium]
MEDQVFDQLARESAGAPTRRTLVQGLAALVGAAGVGLGLTLDAEAGKSKKKKRRQQQKKKETKKKNKTYECEYKDRVCATPTNPCLTVACEDHKCVTSNVANGTACGLGRQCSAGVCACPGGVCNATVTPANLDGWALYNEKTDVQIPATFETGPGSPPSGTGSAVLQTGGDPDKQMMSVRMLNGTRLDELTALTYWTYVTSSTHNTAPHFQIGITRNIDDVQDFWEGRLAFAPHMSEVVPGGWQQWNLLDPANAWFFLSKGGYPDVPHCTQSARCTFPEVLAHYPGIAINPTGPSPDNDGAGWGFIGVMVGSGEGVVDANFDAVTIEVPGSQYNFNFEPNS